jgi:hypothetical protein
MFDNTKRLRNGTVFTILNADQYSQGILSESSKENNFEKHDMPTFKVLTKNI